MKRILSLAALAATLALAGCGGSSHHDAPTTPTTPPPPVSMVDAFFAAIMGIIGDGKETTTEPVATAGIAATTPEDSEPAAVK